MPGEDPFPDAKSKLGVWLLFCLGVQAFMSYDGGATPASLDTIEKEGVSLSQGEIGLLGALDKIGMTLAGIVWGRALQLFPTKPLLVISLFLNAGSTFLFGLLKVKYSMFACKFIMGITQGLQGVWGTVWILTYAPPESKTQWMGMGAIAAGLGNGIGTAIAGFGTANGLSYSFAFFFQACVLGALWGMMLLCPASWFQLPLAQAEEDESGRQVSMDSSSQLTAIFGNKVYVYTALSICQVFFLNSGIQFLWVRMFVEGPWTLDKSWVTVAFLLVTGVGSFVGVALGPALVDKYGGYEDDAGKHRSLLILRRITMSCAAGAAVAVLAVGAHYVWDGSKTTWASLWLWLLFMSVSIMFMGDSATIATHTAINVEVISEEMRSFASGTTISMQNLIGYAGGALLPGVFMDLSNTVYTKITGNFMGIEATLNVGFVFTCCVAGTLLLTVHSAARAAGIRLIDSGGPTMSKAASDTAISMPLMNTRKSVLQTLGQAEIRKSYGLSKSFSAVPSGDCRDVQLGESFNAPGEALSCPPVMG